MIPGPRNFGSKKIWGWKNFGSKILGLKIFFDWSKTNLGPLMDPEIDSARHILGDPCQIKALQGPCDVHIDLFFYIDH